MIIAIDGPAGSGKSTVAKLLAEDLGYLYIDTGAMYRAVTLAWLEQKGHFKQIDSAKDEIILGNILKNLAIHLEQKPGQALQVFLNGRDISYEIRSQAINDYVSYIAAFKSVREKMVSEQRLMSRSHNVILDGRDIGTVVFPDADLKIFLTASPELRAERRLKDFQARGESLDMDKLVEDIRLRDKQDSERIESPLKKADDAIEINTDHLDAQGVYLKIKAIIREI
jgi:cytidylate kinase